MARRNISLPDELDDQARRTKLNVSALAQRAVSDELDRRQRIAALDAWLDDLDATHCMPSAKAGAEAELWLASANAAKQKAKTSPQSRADAAPRARAAG